MDVYDFKYRNDSILKYDVEDKLSNIKAKALIITSTEENGYFNPELDTLPVKDLIEDSKVLIFELNLDNLNYQVEYSNVGNEVILFLYQFKR